MSLFLSSLPDGQVVWGWGIGPNGPSHSFPAPSYDAGSLCGLSFRPFRSSRRISFVMLCYRAVEPACLVPRWYGAAFAVKVLLEWLTPRYRALRVLCSTLTAPAAPKTGTYETRSVSAMPDRDLGVRCFSFPGALYRRGDPCLFDVLGGFGRSSTLLSRTSSENACTGSQPRAAM